MKCNFRISQSVEFDGAFGNLDVHNAYDLEACEAINECGPVHLNFVANQFSLPGKPRLFRVVFTGVILFEQVSLPADLPEFHVDQIGFLEADDFDYQWALADGEPGPDKHFVLKGDLMGAEGRIRISAATAEVEILT